MPIFRSSQPIILYILHTGNLYGTERMALATLDGMPEYEKRIVIAPKPTGRASVAEAARQAGLATQCFQGRGQLLRAILHWFFRYRRVDVISVGVGTSKMCHWLSRIFLVRLRQLQVAHGGTNDAHAYGQKHLLNDIPIGIVAVSEFVRSKLIAHQVLAARISVIENFLSDADRANSPKRLPYDSLPGQPSRRVDPAQVIVAVVSRIDPIKRLDLLVAAVREHGLQQFRFDVYGMGEDLDACRSASAELPNLHFHGFVDDVPLRLQKADLLLHLCPEEPFGLVILEAFAASLVVVVPDQGGAGSLVEDGASGFVFRANDSRDLARVLHAASLTPPTGLQRLAANASMLLDGRFAQSQGARAYRAALDMANRPCGTTGPTGSSGWQAKA